MFAIATHCQRSRKSPLVLDKLKSHGRTVAPQPKLPGV